VTDRHAIHELHTDQLTARQIARIRALLWAAFARDEHGGFSDDDWDHSLGGTHFVLELDGKVLTHASVVERILYVAGVAVRTGYVEAVATLPDEQGKGHGTAVMRKVDELITRDFALGVLGTGSQGFYERLGWRVWRGPSFVRTSAGEAATPDDDGYIMYLLTPSSPALDPAASIVCEWRPGDVW